MTTTQRWRYAIKPASWPKLLVPMVLGQAVGVWGTGELGVAALLFGIVFTVLDGLFIVLLNDWGDQEVDRIKRSMFPDGCSPKTIPDGILPARHVLVAGAVAGLLAALLAAVFGQLLSLPLLFGAAVACLAIFVAYSLPPLRLNYRGGGELLEAIGVGLALPWLNAYAQTGDVWQPAYALFGGFVLLSLSSALASGLSDEESDARGGKTTFTTMWGNRAVRRAAESVALVAVGAWLLVAWRTDVPLWGVLFASVVVGHHVRGVTRVSSDATTNAFAAQKVYKMHLHFAIWYGAVALSAALLVQTYFS